MILQSLLLALPAWCCAAALVVGVRHAALFRRLWCEPVLRVPVVIVESDDWGPGPAADGEILRELAETLLNFRDAQGRAPVMTLGLVLAIPDGRRIAADGYAAYHALTLAEACFAPIVDAIRGGLAARVFSLQRHGFEHLWPASLLAGAQVDPALRAWLADPDARSEALPSALQSRWTDASVRPSRALPAAAVEEAIAAETTLLYTLFGAASRVAVPNTFVWDASIERAWYRHGVEFVVTPGTRYSGRDGDGKLIGTGERLFNGQRSPQGVCHVVRDAYFEPLRGHDTDGVMRDFAARNATARPLLLEMHRENFIRGDAARRASMAALRDALAAVLATRPDTCFMSTVELADLLDDPDSPLHQRGTGARISAWLQRIRHESAIQRALKWSGLGLLLRAILASLRLLPAAVAGPTTVRVAR